MIRVNPNFVTSKNVKLLLQFKKNIIEDHHKKSVADQLPILLTNFY